MSAEQSQRKWKESKRQEEEVTRGMTYFKGTSSYPLTNLVIPRSKNYRTHPRVKRQLSLVSKKEGFRDILKFYFAKANTRHFFVIGRVGWELGRFQVFLFDAQEH